MINNKYFKKLKRVQNPREFRRISNDGWVLKRLSNEQKKYIKEAYEESLDPRNLIPHEVVKARFSKWLSK
jgi:hypothetical protein